MKTTTWTQMIGVLSMIFHQLQGIYWKKFPTVETSWRKVAVFLMTYILIDPA